MCVLPKWISDNILDHLIFPVLHREVESWNPLTDSVPIHSWLHPWLPLMHDRLEPLYQSIRTKLAKALESWQPSDSSAKSVLSPWRRVFKQGTWDGFMNKYIVPKLVTTMQQFVIDPRQQVLGKHTQSLATTIAWNRSRSLALVHRLARSRTPIEHDRHIGEDFLS